MTARPLMKDLLVTKSALLFHTAKLLTNPKTTPLPAKFIYHTSASSASTP